MNLTDKLKNAKGCLIVEVEGFFTERFLNVCRVNNIPIYDVINITNTVVRFTINISEFKKLRMVAKKTKCRVKIIKKKGIYFLMFKYRKRNLLFFLLLLFILFFIISTCFIWKINIEDSKLVNKTEIRDILKDNGIYIGRLKLGLDKNYILKNIRADLTDISWVGLEINGTSANLKLIDKVILNENEIQDKTIGNIIAKKSGVLTRLIVENGNATLKEGSYINSGDIIIDGGDSHAKGIVKANVEYVFENKYNYNNIVKENNGKVSYRIEVNKKEIGYLNKDKKYDRIVYSKNIIGLSFNIIKYVEYVEKEVIYSSEDITNIYNEDLNKYFNDNILNKNIIDEKEKIVEDTNGIIFNKIYVINEEIGEFIKK